MPWVKLPDALGEQERLDPVLDPDPLLHQVLALTVRALGVLLRRAGHPEHAAHLAVASVEGRQHPQQALSVQAVSLRPPSPSADEDTGGLDHVAGHPIGEQEAVQPEAVAPRLETADNIDRAS